MALPALAYAEILSGERTGRIYVSFPNFPAAFALYLGVPLLVLVFVVLGLVTCVEAALGKCRRWDGVPRARRRSVGMQVWRRLMWLLMGDRTGQSSPVDFDSAVTSGMPIRIYRSRIWGVFRGWERTDITGPHSAAGC
jgi:hypothetical protein